jgi:nitrate/nitrite transporter NarK
MTGAAGRHRHAARRLSFAAGKRRGPLGALVHAISDHLDVGYKRRTIVLLLLVFVVDYADRTLIGALGPTLKNVFHLDNTGLGALGAAFGVVGALATIPLGMLTDRVKRTLLLAISLAIWAVASAATGTAVSM